MVEWILRGREYPELAAIELRADAAAAIALSRGGAPKRYAHTDPNEDVALLLQRAEGLLLAVADGHGGFEAAEIALDTVRAWAGELSAPIASAAAWRALALRGITRANEAIRANVAGGGRRLSRTTLAFVFVDAARSVIRWASIGDSHVFHAANGVLDLAHAHAHDQGTGDQTFFLGAGDESTDSLAGKCRIGEEQLLGTQAILLVTDGLSERGVGVDEPEDAVAEAVLAAAELPEAERASALARRVVEVALAAHKRRRSGDNIATAVAWLASLRGR